MQRRLGIAATATDVHFGLFGDRQAHHAHHTVAGRRSTAEVQVRATLEALGGLANQGGRPRVQAASMSDADLAEHFDADVRFIVACFTRCLADDVQQRLADLDPFEGNRPSLEVLAIGDDQQADQAFAALCHAVQVIPQQRLAVADPRALLDQHGKTVALQFDSVQPQMQQQFGAVVGPQGHGVAGASDVDHLAVTGGVEGVVQRIDGDPVAHGAAGEHRVRDVGEGEHRPAERGAEGQLFIVVGHGLALFVISLTLR